MASDEAAIIRRARGGDMDAFNTLVLTYQDQAYTLAYHIMGDPDSAADSTQDAFIAAYRRLETYRGGSFRAWLLRIVTNACYDELRRRKRRPAQPLADDDGDENAPIPDNAPSPEQVAQQSELSRAIQSCIESLGARQRTVLILSDIQGFSYDEIAATLGINLGTVKSRLSRARVAVRDCLRAVPELLPQTYRLTDEANDLPET
jgi:RNA polymerase sigma-70 factor (ECF subfamily)